MQERKYREAEQALWEYYAGEPSEEMVSLPHTGTTVRVQETGEGEPVLFIHGGPNAGSTWVPLAVRMDGFRCLLVDRPGTGLSQAYPVSAQNLPAFGAEFVGDVLDGLGIEEADVVASSFGGHLALRSAAAHPGRIRKMVQMAAPAAVPGQTFPPFMKSIRSPFARRVMNTLPPLGVVNRTIFRQLGHGASLDTRRIPDVFFDWYLALGRYTDTMRHDGEMIGAELLPHVESLTLTSELLASVPTPTLFLWGADDGFGREDNARFVTALLPNADLLMIPEAGHLPWLDDPELAADRTRAFLSMETAPREPDGASIG